MVTMKTDDFETKQGKMKKLVTPLGIFDAKRRGGC